MFTPAAFIIDVDGVMTDGKFHYTENGSLLNPNDVHGLKQSDLYAIPNKV